MAQHQKPERNHPESENGQEAEETEGHQGKTEGPADNHRTRQVIGPAEQMHARPVRFSFAFHEQPHSPFRSFQPARPAKGSRGQLAGLQTM